MPLDSGWIYLMGAQGALQAWKKSQTTDGSIDFEFAGISTEYTRGGSSPPQVTLPNDGVTDSSAALLWILMGEPLPESSEWFFKDMLEVAAYKAVPDSDGVLQKVWSYPATSRHFSSPGVGNNGFIYVATLEGYVYGFGSGSNYSAPENWNYVGCYTDNGTQPVLGTQHGTDYYTVDQCTAAALSAGYSYAGLRAGGLCFFGSALQSAQSTSLTNCDLPCTAATSSGQVCGGNTTISVFSTTASGSNSPTNGSSSGSSSKLSTGAIAGIAVAAVVVAAALIVGAVVLVRNRAHKAGEFDADDAAAAGAASSSAGAAAGAGGSRDLDPPILLTALGGERGAFDNSSQSSQIRLPAAGVTPAGAQQ
ncbi:hypothetical protein HK405_016078 [Cladochytrium tenue]|nr:hypothetical protein HK405_016078 [Cladochytrium tenue]